MQVIFGVINVDNNKINASSSREYIILKLCLEHYFIVFT